MAATRRPATARGRERREMILDAAADLVADRGFHAVGVSDIGAAAGVSGAALYRHFATKTDVLVALFERAVDGLLAGADEVVAAGGGDDTTLEALVARHVAFSLRERSLLAVYMQEEHSLPAEDRRRLRRTQRRYVETWRVVLRRLLPELGEGQALARVEATFGLLNSAPHLSSSLTDDALRGELARMATAALLAPAGG